MNCPKCYWWAHTSWDGEWYCADDLPDKIDVSTLVEKISEDMKKVTRGYVFDPMTPETTKKLQEAFGEVLERWSPMKENISKYLIVTTSLTNPDLILIGPKDDAPQWVFELFNYINQIINIHEKEDN